MTKYSEINSLERGKMLSPFEMERLMGNTPPQSEFPVDVYGDGKVTRRCFRRHRVAGMEAWEVTQ